jgi:hypothetical protein
MPIIHTLGHPSKRTVFRYNGSVKEGVVLDFTGRPCISPEFFTTILTCFKDAKIPAGTTNPEHTRGGLGVWVEVCSQEKNTVKLSPLHAPFIAAILVHEGYITSCLKGDAVYLHF